MKEKLKTFINKFKFGLIMLLVGIIIAVFDLITKAVTDGKSVNLINGFISIFSSHNTGAAWSILNEHTWLLIIISIIFIGVIVYANWVFKKKNFLYAFSMGLILSGAICNLFDRVVFGYVRDFISLDFMNFPIFNLADCAITVGVIMLIIFFIILWIREERPSKVNITINNEKEFNSKSTKVNNVTNQEKKFVTNDIKDINLVDTAQNNMQENLIENNEKVTNHTIVSKKTSTTKTSNITKKNTLTSKKSVSSKTTSKTNKGASTTKKTSATKKSNKTVGTKEVKSKKTPTGKTGTKKSAKTSQNKKVAGNE